MIKINERIMITVVPFWMDLSASVFYLAAVIVIELSLIRKNSQNPQITQISQINIKQEKPSSILKREKE